LFLAAVDGRVALRGILYGKTVKRFRAGAMDSDHRRHVLHDLSLPHPDHFQPDDADIAAGFDHEAVQPRLRIAVPADPACGLRGLRIAVLLRREAVYAVESLATSGEELKGGADCGGRLRQSLRKPSGALRRGKWRHDFRKVSGNDIV